MTADNNNVVTLSGTVATAPQFSHEIYGEKFYEIMLSVTRLSSASDLLPVSVSDRLMSEKLEVGNKVTVVGQLRSYNKQIENHSKLMLTVFVKDILPYDESVANEIKLVGYLCKKPVYRTTPFNREITDILVAVNRHYNKSDYIPLIAWGRNARFCSNLLVGQQLSITGRVQSRQYNKRISDDNVIVKTAYEVSISNISVVDVTNTEEKGCIDTCSGYAAQFASSYK